MKSCGPKMPKMCLLKFPFTNFKIKIKKGNLWSKNAQNFSKNFLI